MKKAIIEELDARNIGIGEEITDYQRADICRSIAGDRPEKINRFYKAWYQVTDDGPGCGAWPNNPRRIK